MGNSLPNVPSPLRRSGKNLQTVEEENQQGEIELEILENKFC